jgi:ATP-binding cassette subfamily G (WHITE) protein 2 (SNQ2)
MPSTRPPSHRRHTSDEDHTAVPSNQFESYVHISAQNKDDIVSLNHTLTGHSGRHAQQYPEAHEALNGFLLGENQKLSDAGLSPPRLGVCFKNITTWGSDQGSSGVKTLATAIWRTLTFQDVYEMTLKRWASPPAEKEGRALIRNFSGVVGAGEMMLYDLPLSVCVSLS